MYVFESSCRTPMMCYLTKKICLLSNITKSNHYQKFISPVTASDSQQGKVFKHDFIKQKIALLSPALDLLLYAVISPLLSFCK